MQKLWRYKDWVMDKYRIFPYNSCGYYGAIRESFSNNDYRTYVVYRNMAADDLLAQARRLEADALVQIHNTFYPELYRYVRFRLDDEQVGEDITAEVFLRLLDALDKGRGPSQKLRGWLFGTASNLVNDHLRQRYAGKIDPMSVDDVVLIGDDNPESEFEENNKQQRVRQAILELTADQQHVLALRFSEERSLRETADIMGKSVAAVKALQFRAVAALQRQLSE